VVWRSKRNRYLLVLVAVLVAGLGVGLGFAFSGSSSGNRLPSGSASPRSETPTTATSQAGGPTAGAAPPCPLSELRVTIGPEQSNAGHAGKPIVFKNTSRSHCQLSGYPQVTAFGPAGARIASPVELPGGFVGGVGPNGTPPNVVLLPGAVASAMLEAANTPLPAASRGGLSTTTTSTTAACNQIATVQVSVPGSTGAVSLPLGLTYCYGFAVHPFVSGPTGG
jgi:hypothetical protein